MLSTQNARRAVAATVAAIGVFAAVQTQAEILLARNNTNAIVFGGATYIVDFNGSASGGTSLTFATSAPNTRVMIIFNAECAVEGAENKWVDIDILVDPAGPTGEFAVAPSNSDNAFCSGNGTSTATPTDFSLDGWVSATTVVAPLLPQAGTHTLRIRVKGGTAGITLLDDMSLTVVR